MILFKVQLDSVEILNAFDAVKIKKEKRFLAQNLERKSKKMIRY